MISTSPLFAFEYSNIRFATALIATFAVLAIAAPTGSHQKRAAVLATKTYDECIPSPVRILQFPSSNICSRISISGGKAGNAKAEALAVFCALDLTDMATIDFLSSINDIANDAETGAFNVAIAAASGDAKTALQNVKIKNKNLKLMATNLELTIKLSRARIRRPSWR